MKAHEQDEKSLRRDIYALRRVLRPNIEEVDKYITEHKRVTKNIGKLEDKRDAFHIIPDVAVRKMAELEKQMRLKSVRSMDKSELITLFRQLKYISDLKSSTLEGAKKITKNFNSLAPILSKLDDDQIKKMWDVYEKLVETGMINKDLKYNIQTVIANIIPKLDLSAEEIALVINNIYDKKVRGDLDDQDQYDEPIRLVIRSIEKFL